MSRTTLGHRRSGRAVAVPSLVAAVLLALVATVAQAGTANAAAYRYWGFFQLQKGTWAFATQGPDQVTPAEGAVDGWRFAVGGEGDSRMPRATPTFDDLCAGTAAQSGKKRVGVVIDYGRAADTADGKQPPTPVGKCAVVDTKATSAEVLAAVASVRAEKSLVCAIDGQPATGCGEEVKTLSAEARASDTPVQLAAATPSAQAGQGAADTQESGTSPLAYVAIVVVLAAAALLVVSAARRRRTH